jgi:hypothetical protein
VQARSTAGRIVGEDQADARASVIGTNELLRPLTGRQLIALDDLLVHVLIQSDETDTKSPPHDSGHFGVTADVRRAR